MASDNPNMPQAALGDLNRVQDIAHWVLMHSSMVNMPDGCISIEHLNRALAQAFEAGRRFQTMNPNAGSPSAKG